jgi:hypothetical protein
VKRCAWAQVGHCHDPLLGAGRGGVRYRGTSRKCRAWAVSLARFSAARRRDLVASRDGLSSLVVGGELTDDPPSFMFPMLDRGTKGGVRISPHPRNPSR